jgi:hypothetical protein
MRTRAVSTQSFSYGGCFTGKEPFKGLKTYRSC